MSGGGGGGGVSCLKFLGQQTSVVNRSTENNYYCENILAFEFMNELSRHTFHTCTDECADSESKKVGCSYLILEI